MRNKTAFIFVLLANMILLAHAVIPHHHNTEGPMEIAIECSHHEQHSHHHNLPICDGNHEKGETTTCVLTASAILPNNQFRATQSIEQAIDSDVLLFTLFVYIYLNISNTTDFKTEVLDDIPLYARLLSTSQGLRAPPVC